MYRMVDIGSKKPISRSAIARGILKLKKESIRRIVDGRVSKGDPFKVAEIAGISAAKKTWELIPLCHQIPLESVKVRFRVEEDHITCECEVKANYKTGVEMDALVGVSIALLTVWDMIKEFEKDEKGQYPEIRIESIEVVEKRKGGE